MAFPTPKQTQHHQYHPLPTVCSGGATSAPPPTPSNHHHHLGKSSSDAAAADILSRLLHRLPPTLSLPTRRATTSSSSTTNAAAASTATPLPILSLSADETDDKILHAASLLGVFQLIDHGICPELARGAESEASSLFDLSLERKESLFPRDWPLGYEGADDEEDGDERTESFCLDSSSHRADSTEFSLTSLHDFTGKMDKIGLKIVEGLFNALGFGNPVHDPTRICSLLWISRAGPAGPRPAYPCVVGLDYQIRNQKYTVVTDSIMGPGSGSGSVSVSPQVDSVMVTLGDIAQVWSNGKLKKVIGKPLACCSEGNTTSTTMSLLVTLPLESTVSPLLVKTIVDKGHEEVKMTNEPETNEISNKGKQEEDEEEEDDDDDDKVMFSSFSFEDYAWRVYHERLPIKDPLDRYRT